MTTNERVHGFDFHCHVDLHPNPAEIVARCETARVAVVAVTTTPRAWEQNELWTRNSRYVHAAAGLHPELVAARHSEIAILERAIRHTRLVGEVGLDGSRQHQHSYQKQKEVFLQALDAAQRYGNRVMSIHCRRADDDAIRLIERHTDPSRVICILHWFSGSPAQARRAADAGCYFSVNAAMLAHDRGRTLVQSIPPRRLLTETDSPLMEMHGRKAVPWDALGAAEQVATVTSQSVQETRLLVAANARRVFRFAGIELPR